MLHCAALEALLDTRVDPPTFLETSPEALGAHGNILDQLHRGERTGVVVRGAFPAALVQAGVEHLADSTAWTSPNQGMPGGEIRTIGDAAPPWTSTPRAPTATPSAAARSSATPRPRSPA